MTASFFAFFIQLFTGVQARWEGCMPDPVQRIYFPNHTSNLDFLAVWAALPPELRRRTRPVAAHDYWTSGPLKKHLADEVFRAVLIERKKVTRTNNPMEKMLAVLDAGDSLIIFPEGGRLEEGEARTFKAGIHHMAEARPSVELVPVYIDNLNRVLPKGEILMIPLLCSVTFGTPLHLQEGEAKADFLERARKAVFDLAPA